VENKPKPKSKTKTTSIEEQWVAANEKKETEKVELQSYSEPIAIDPSLIKKEEPITSISELENMPNNNSITKVVTTEKENETQAFSDKGNTQNADEMITKVEQVETEENKTDLVKKDLTNKSLANASVDDFENILFFSNVSTVEMVSILEDEQNNLLGKGETRTMVATTPVKIIKREKLVKNTTTPTPPAEVIIEPTPEPEVIDKSNWLVFTDLPDPSVYSILIRTSLRKKPHPQAKILKRLAVGTEMEFIKRIDKYWYKVNLDGQIGYVKSYRLVKVK